MALGFDSGLAFLSAALDLLELFASLGLFLFDTCRLARIPGLKLFDLAYLVAKRRQFAEQPHDALAALVLSALDFRDLLLADRESLIAFG